MRPVLKKRALVLHQSRKHAVLIAMHAAEQGQMMRTLKNVDRIHLNKAHLLDEALQGCRRGAARRSGLSSSPCAPRSIRRASEAETTGIWSAARLVVIQILCPEPRKRFCCCTFSPAFSKVASLPARNAHLRASTGEWLGQFIDAMRHRLLGRGALILSSICLTIAAGVFTSLPIGRPLQTAPIRHPVPLPRGWQSLSCSALFTN